MLGPLLRRLRKQSGLRAPEVAAELGVIRRTVYAYESGDILPAPAKLGHLLELYAATPGEKLDAFVAYTQRATPDDESEAVPA